MKSPFFSILLPTRNRSEILVHPIQSVLAQTFDDFELIVSDNDESPSATRDAVARFQDSRIRYLRTSGQLAMHDNWENALRHATGQFVLVIEDKQALTPTALAALHHVCSQNTEAIVSYPAVMPHTDQVSGPVGPPRSRRFTSEQVIEEFCRFTATYSEIFPRGLTSCTPRALMERIRAQSPTGMVFSYVNPDYAYAFQALSLARELIYLPECIIYVPNSVGQTGRYSNGLAGIRKLDSFRQFLRTLPVTEEQMLASVPVKSIYLWVNPVIYDFHVFYRRPGHHTQVDWACYHAQCLHLILFGWLWQADIKDELRATWCSMRATGWVFTLRVLALALWRNGLAAVRRLLRRLGLIY